MAAIIRTLIIACFIILQSIIALAFSSGCPAEFEELCECGYVPYGLDKRLTYVTNCTNTGFDNAIMLRKLPQETEVLIFVGNEVKDLNPNIFAQDILYEKLHTIDLSNNHIQSIKGKTFHNVANVTKLILNDNDLYIVSKDHHPRMFSNFVNLKELHLRNAFTEKVKAGDYLNNLVQIFENSTLKHLQVLNMENNEISGISHGEFCSLPSLEHLHLGNNHLKDISLNFSCLKNLKVLDVGSNLISSLSESSLKNLETFKNNSHFMLNLTANPFRCDCNMVKTYIWIMTTTINLVNRDHYYCYDGFPPIIGKNIVSVQLDELQCLPVIHKYEYHTTPSFITLTVGLFCLFVVLTVVLYRNRDALTTSIRRVLYPLRSKFHYVSLDRRATMEV